MLPSTFRKGGHIGRLPMWADSWLTAYKEEMRLEGMQLLLANVLVYIDYLVLVPFQRQVCLAHEEPPLQ